MGGVLAFLFWNGLAWLGVALIGAALEWRRLARLRMEATGEGSILVAYGSWLRSFGASTRFLIAQPQHCLAGLLFGLEALFGVVVTRDADADEGADQDDGDADHTSSPSSRTRPSHTEEP